MINRKATPATTQTMGLFIQAGAGAGDDVVVCVSVELVCVLEASCANAYVAEIIERNNRKNLERILAIVFFITVVLVFQYVV